MRKRSIFHDTLPERAMDFAHRVGGGLRQAAPDGAGKWLHDVSGEAGKWLQSVPQEAGKWLQAGVAVGAARTGVRAAGTVARRHPVAMTAAAIGIGAALYAVVRHRRKLAEQAAYEGRSQRIREALDQPDVDPHATDIGDRGTRVRD